MGSEGRIWTETPTTLPPCRRYILAHSPDGKPIVHSSPPQMYSARSGVGGVARSYAVATVPAQLESDQDVQKYLSEDPAAEPTSHKGTDIVISNHTGANLLVIDLEPGAVGTMHQTVSIDYSVCVIGDLDMKLDNGEIIHLKPGDHVIQRGTMHQWINPSKTEPARYFSVTLPCEPFEIAGEMLEEKVI